MGNIIVAQSGGPTVAINASLAGVIDGALNSKYDKIYGSINGILGIKDDNIIGIDTISDIDTCTVISASAARRRRAIYPFGSASSASDT